jgi:hypothetical protein
MVESELTPELVNEGAALIAKLDSAGASPDAAMWVYFPEKGGWRLLIADVKRGSAGPREVYRQIQKALTALRHQVAHLSLENVAITKPDTPLVKRLRQAIAMSGTGGVRFKKNVVNGTRIEDAYIYRLHRPAA